MGAGQGWMLGRGSELQAGRAVVHSGVWVQLRGILHQGEIPHQGSAVGLPGALSLAQSARSTYLFCNAAPQPVMCQTWRV